MFNITGYEKNLRILFLMAAIFMAASCSNNKPQQVTEKTPLEIWRDSIGKIEQTLSFNGDTVGVKVFEKYTKNINEDWGYYEYLYGDDVAYPTGGSYGYPFDMTISDKTIIKYPEDGETKTEDNVYRTYYLYYGKVYKITLETDNYTAYKFMLDTYKERFNYPDDTDGIDSLAFVFKNTRIDIKRVENSSRRTLPDGTSYEVQELYDSRFMPGYIYSISYTDIRLQNACDKHRGDNEKRFEEKHKKEQNMKDKKTEELSKELQNQF